MDAEHPHFDEQADSDLAEYRTLCVSAVVALVLGLLSALAVVNQLMLIFPLSGATVSCYALWRIATHPTEMVGRKAAVAGLLLSTLFGTGVFVQGMAYRWMIDREAERFARMWFGLATQGEGQKSYQLTLPYKERRPLDDNLADFYRMNHSRRQEFEAYAANPLMKKLLAMKDKPEVELAYKCGHWRDEAKGLNYARHVYELKYEDDGKPVTLPVGLGFERSENRDGTATWKITEMAENLEDPHWKPK